MPNRRSSSLARIPIALLRAGAAVGVELGSQLQDLSSHGTDPDRRVPLASLETVWRDLVARDSDPALGLRLGRQIRVHCLGLVGYAMASSRSLGEALDRLTRYSRILRDDLQCRFERGMRTATIVLHDRARPGETVPQQADARLAALLAFCRELTGRHIVPSTVDLPHVRPRNTAGYRRTFGSAELRFERPTAALSLHALDLEHPIASADGTLAGYLDRLASDMLSELGDDPLASFAGQVASAITMALADGSASIDSIGGVLGVSDRTLQRRLLTAGTSFAAILETVRRQQAEQLLRDRRLTVENVARRLGYSEPSTFYRAFRSWHGTSPGAFRDGVTGRRRSDT
jgi:AraC-like DNA-binding protein